MNFIKDLFIWISGPAGIAALTALWQFYRKIQSDAKSRKQVASDEHADHAARLAAMQASLDALAANLTAAQAEAAAMRAERDAAQVTAAEQDKKISRLEAERARLIAAIPARADGEKKKV